MHSRLRFAISRGLRKNGWTNTSSWQKKSGNAKGYALLAVTRVALVLASGVALAATIKGNGSDNRLIGTSKADQIYGLGGADRIFARSGNDEAHGGAGRDIPSRVSRAPTRRPATAGRTSSTAEPGRTRSRVARVLTP